MAKVEAARGVSGGGFPSSSSSVGIGGAISGGMGGSFRSCRAGADSSYRAGADPAFEEWAARQGYSHLLPSPDSELPAKKQKARALQPAAAAATLDVAAAVRSQLRKSVKGQNHLEL